MSKTDARPELTNDARRVLERVVRANGTCSMRNAMRLCNMGKSECFEAVEFLMRHEYVEVYKVPVPKTVLVSELPFVPAHNYFETPVQDLILKVTDEGRERVSYVRHEVEAGKRLAALDA